MATKTKYLEYTIHLTDRAAVTAHQAAFPFGVRVAPAEAAVTYAAPILGNLASFVAPCTRSPWFWTSANYPQTEATFTRKSGGWFGLPIFATTTTFIWVGKFVFGEGTVAMINGVAVQVVAMAQRQWVDGFEIPEEGEGGISTTARRCLTRDASRHPDGMGFAFRGDSLTISHQVSQFSSSTSHAHWDRFYIRVRKVPAANAKIWRSNGGAGQDGIELALTPGLNIVVSDIASGVPTIKTTSSAILVAGVWARIDVVLSYATAGGGVGAFVKVYKNGTLIASHSSFTAAGLGTNGVYTKSLLGSPDVTDLEADFDDWIGAAEPLKESASPFRYVGLDWLNGSKVIRASATSFGTGHDAVNWTNQSYSNLNQLPESAVTGMVSTTALAPIVVNTDVALKVDAQPNTLGIAALLVGVYHNGVTAGQSSLGFKIGTAAEDLVVLPSISGLAHEHHWYMPAGVILPTKLTTLVLRYLKDNNASSDTVYHLGAVAEVVGTFGAEDVFPGATTPTTIPRRSLGAHNNPYPESPWARLIAAPASPYIIHSGTYVGNGTGQDLVFRCPVHWFYTRRTGISTHPIGLWFSSMIASHQSLQEQVQPDVPVQAFIDPSFVSAAVEDDQEQRTIVRITGADAQVNESAITYEYVAVSDPAGRFLLTGVFGHGAQDFDNVDLLPNETFAPEAGFFQYETPDGGSTFRGYYKGVGHAAATVSLLNAAEVIDFLTWSAGLLSPLVASTLSLQLNAAFALWRREDGSADPGRSKAVQMGSYTGDGVAARTIGFGPTLVRPLWVMVVPHNAAAIVRDPSHTGTTSCPVSGVNNATTGITAGGIDSFTVGVTLNAAGIIYDWFVLPGGTAACNNGWSCDGEFTPIEPESPFDGPFPIGDEEVDPGDGGPGEGDLPPSDTDDCAAGTVCIEETTAQVNLSLLEIGVSQTLTNYCTQGTREARIARLLYETSVRATLTMTPWPFATRYAALVLVAAQPSHADWAFSYRQPIDCIFPRRIVVVRGTAKDPEPPAFMLSSDGSGGLILTNEAAAVLEYTCRPACVAFTGDALFTEALKWHLSAALAPPLTRMTSEAERCTKMFEATIDKANAIIKPGVPGLRTAVPLAGDEAAACVTANIQVVNRGLLRIGCQTIANLATDQSPPAVLANIILDDEIRATLRDYPWKFAKRYNDALVTVGGTATVAVNPDWQYSYRLPTDYVMVRRLVATGTGRAFEDSPPPWEVGTDATGDLLFTDELDPNLEYTARINCAVQKGDDLFRDALAWRLAAALAPSLAQIDPAVAEQRGRGPESPTDPRQRVSHKPNQAGMRAQATRYAQAMYQVVLERARVQDANEAEPEDPPDAEWIRGR
jgi:hypothetical protein